MKNKELRFRGFCIDHDWEGMSQVEKLEAEKDLSAHKDSFPDEPHDDSGVHEIEV